MAGNNPPPIAYAFTSEGVFCSNDGTDFVTGVGQSMNVSQLLAIGNVVVVYDDHIFLGNSSVNATINSTVYTGHANGGNGGGSFPGGPNSAIQFNQSGAFGGNSYLTFDGVSVWIGNSTVNVSINSTAFSGVANSATYVGSLPASNVVSNAQLQANLANYVTLSDLVADAYVNTAQLSANLAGYVTLSGLAADAYVNTAQLSANLANYLTSVPPAYVQNTDSRVLSGNLEFSGTNVRFDTGFSVGNSTVNVAVNSTSFSGTTNSALFIGSLPALNVVSNSQLQANLANYLTAVPATYLQNTDSRTLSGNLNFTGANVNFVSVFATPNAVHNTTGFYVGNTTQNAVVNSTGLYVNGSIVGSGSGIPNTYNGTMSGNLVFSGANVSFTTGFTVGSNVILTTSSLEFGNSTYNSFTNSSIYFVGNSTVYTVQNATGFFQNGLTSKPGFRALNQSNTSLGNNATTALTFGNTILNVGGFYSNSTGKWTPPAGMVTLAGSIWCVASGAIGELIFEFTKNGSVIAEFASVANTADQTVGGSVCDLANGTDTYGVSVYYYSSVAGVTAYAYGPVGGSVQSYFSGAWIG